MKFEEAGKAIDTEIAKLIEFLDKKVKPSTRQEMARMLKKASERMTRLAENLERSSK